MHREKRNVSRFAILAAAAGVTIWLALTLEPHGPEPVVSAAQSVTARHGVPADEPHSRFAALAERAGMGVLGIDLFGSRSWAPPPAAIPQTVAAAVPPPLPYRYAGMLAQGGEVQVLLARDDRVVPAIPGQILDGDYRVESVSAQEIVLLYLPLNARQTVPAGPAIGRNETVASGADLPRAFTPDASPAESPADDAAQFLQDRKNQPQPSAIGGGH